MDTTSTQSKRRVSPKSLANLRPFPKGVSPNPGGKPGGGKKARSGKRISPAMMRNVLLRELRRDQNYTKVCQAWIKQAIAGNGLYLRELLARVMPLEGAETGQKVIMEGIRLELSSEDGKTISATMLSGSAPASLAAPEEEEPRDLEAE